MNYEHKAMSLDWANSILFVLQVLDFLIEKEDMVDMTKTLLKGL